MPACGGLGIESDNPYFTEPPPVLTAFFTSIHGLPYGLVLPGAFGGMVADFVCFPPVKGYEQAILNNSFLLSDAAVTLGG